MATPAIAVRSAISRSKTCGLPRCRTGRSSSRRRGRRRRRRSSSRPCVLGRLAARPRGQRHGQLLDLTIELPDAGLAGVIAYDRAERVVGEGDLAVGDAVLARSPCDQVAARDVDLLVGRVAGELDDLQAIAERCRHRLEDVRGAHEHHLGEIERELEVVVAERVVLFRVEDLEHRGAGSPPQSAPILSISSSRTTGFVTLALRRARRMRPGRAPT